MPDCGTIVVWFSQAQAQKIDGRIYETFARMIQDQVQDTQEDKKPS